MLRPRFVSKYPTNHPLIPLVSPPDEVILEPGPISMTFTFTPFLIKFVVSFCMANFVNYILSV